MVEILGSFLLVIFTLHAFYTWKCRKEIKRLIQNKKALIELRNKDLKKNNELQKILTENKLV